MPLQDHYPAIDDRTFDDLVAEAKTRIPRYTPEWTDHNDNDVGIAFIELFAWLAEMQIYRMAQVPKLNYLKFLELIGIELTPAIASTGRLSFALTAGTTADHVIVPARTQVTPDDTDDAGRPIVFETDRALIALKAQLAVLQAYDGVGYRDFTTSNDDTLATLTPFGSRAAKGDAMLLGFDGPIPPVDFALTVWVEDDTGGNGAAPGRACVDPAALVPAADLSWEYFSQSREWRPLDLLQDTTGALTRSGEVQLKGPSAGDMLASSLGNATADRYWVRARIASATYERPPEILALRTNTVAVTQAETIEFETVGASDGVVAQSLTLRRTPVLAGTLALELDEGGGFEPWEERPDLIGSGPDDPHYVLNRSTGTIQFGDGVHGRIPVANPRNTSNVRARTYRVGGGGKGNLGPNTLTNLRRGVTGIDGDAVTNPFPTGAGQDEETLDEARDRAALALRSRDRAVTAEDFEYLATTAGNVARAKTLPLSHPEFPGIDVPGVVTVIVVPDVDTAQNPKPTPSEATLANVCACLNARRLVTTELYVRAPTYQEVAIDATLVVSDEADLAEVKNTALATLSAYFDPLSGGEDGTLDSAGSGWPFGGDIFYSLVFRRLLLAGVKRIESLAIRLDGTEYPPCSDVALSPGALLCNGPHAIEVRYELG